MTVGELIAKLQQINPDAKCVITDLEGDYADINAVEETNLWLHYYSSNNDIEFYYTRERSNYKPERYNLKLVPAVILSF